MANEMESDAICAKSSLTRSTAVASPLFFCLSLLESPPPALLRRGVPAQLVFGFRHRTRDFDGTTVSVDGNERQIARVGVPASPVSRSSASTRTPTSIETSAHVVDARLHDDQVAEMNRLAKVDAVDRRRDDVAFGCAETRRSPRTCPSSKESRRRTRGPCCWHARAS